MSTRQVVGQSGEEVVAKYIEAIGWRIIAKNWRCNRGELDIVAYDGDELVFIEVRTRRGKALTQKALESVGPHKLQKLVELSTLFIDDKFGGRECSLRFDIFGVSFEPDGLYKIEHVRDALQW